MVATESPASRRRPVPLDPVCAAAVDQARAALAEEVPEASIGEHLEVVAEDERVVSHSFACTELAYHGWYWSVVLARASRSRQATVSEVLLLPGAEALLAPEWLPWSERLRPGDLGVGDLLPTAADDLRLAPGSAPSLEDDTALLDSVALWELGLGRPRVLSIEGRDEAAERWHTGSAGPRTPIAEVAPAQCVSCGFFTAISGSLGRTFGVCANEFAPDDGRVVAVDHGCGAHSEAAVVPVTVAALPVVDDLGFDLMERGDDTPADPPGDAHGESSVDPADPPEELGHS